MSQEVSSISLIGFQFDSSKNILFQITDKDLPSSWENRKIFFYLVCEGPGFKKEAQVLLDIRGGTVFIQTSKPVYRPTDTGKICTSHQAHSS